MKCKFFMLVFLCVVLNLRAEEIKLSSVIDTTVVSDENTVYKVFQDDANVYVNIQASDEKTIMTMLHLGVSVYFDIKGKKKKDVYIKYPAEAIRPEQKNNRREQEQPGAFKEEIDRGKLISEILENEYSEKAKYVYYDSEEEFNILLNNLDVVITMNYNAEEGVLEYNLSIPKEKINEDLSKDLNKLVIGVKTEKEAKKSKDGGELNGSIGGLSLGGQQSGGRSGGGPPGGGQGGRSGGSGQGGRKGGPPKGGDMEKPSEKELDFWFKADLQQ